MKKNKLFGRKITLIIVFSLLICFNFFSFSNGIIIEKASLSTTGEFVLYVGGKGSNNYTSIQDAIDDAADGDIVFVYGNSLPYYENIVIDKSINIIGENINTTIIDGDKKDDVIYVSADWVNVSGFTIRNSKESWQYAGIKISNSNHVNIFNNEIRNNFGQGIFIKSINSYGNNIIENNIKNNGYGLYIVDSSDNIISRNIIKNNSNGLYIVDSSDNIISNNIFVNRWTGLHAERSWNNIISENVIINTGDGIYFYNSTYNVISKNVISDNMWFGIWFSDSSHNTITKNTISRNDDIGIYLDSSSSNNITENTISDNDDGIYLECSSGTRICNNNFKNLKLNAYFVARSYSHCKNIWDQNYWDRSRLSPYYISGKIKLEIVHIPWLDFDWDPLDKPFEQISTSLGLCDDTSNQIEDVFYVGGSGLGNFTRIQDAIDVAGQGDTIFVFSGMYYENVIIDKSINLLGENRNTTVIDGNGYEDVISIFADGVVIKGFTVQNGHFGILMQNISNQITCGNNIIYNLHGISLWHCNDINISKNVFLDNQYGIRLYLSSYVDVHYNNFKSYKLHAFFVEESYNPCRSKWNRNYWGDSRWFPHPISGKVTYENILLRWIHFDWQPLDRPCEFIA